MWYVIWLMRSQSLDAFLPKARSKMPCPRIETWSKKSPFIRQWAVPYRLIMERASFLWRASRRDNMRYLLWWPCTCESSVRTWHRKMLSGNLFIDPEGFHFQGPFLPSSPLISKYNHLSTLYSRYNSPHRSSIRESRLGNRKKWCAWFAAPWGNLFLAIRSCYAQSHLNFSRKTSQRPWNSNLGSTVTQRFPDNNETNLLLNCDNHCTEQHKRHGKADDDCLSDNTAHKDLTVK